MSITNHHNHTNNPSFLTDLLAGSITAATTKTAAAPLERVKLLMQTQAANRDLVVPYRHTWDCVVRVAREQGWRSFWRGNVASVLRYFPQQAFTFATKDTFQRWFSSPAHTTWWHRALANLAAGGLAGGVTLLAAYPLDVVRTRMATDVRRADGGMLLRSCVRQIWADGGVGAFYRGLPVALTGVVVFKVCLLFLFLLKNYLLLTHTHIIQQALHMGGYDTAKSHLHADASVWLRLAVAQAITTGAGTLCFPFDTVKRRLMVQEQQLMVLAAGAATAAAATAGPAKYRNGMHCVRVILREEGYFGLYAGLPANLLRGLSGSLLLVGYDEAKKFLQSRQKE
jgi:solute carrier family 25 (adenine nucleotide translocator) protein 4/5/6/31